MLERLLKPFRNRMWLLPNPSIPVNWKKLNLYLFMFISIYLFLEFLKNLEQGQQKTGKVGGKPKNTDWNILQVKRFTGNRWLCHVVYERGFLKRLGALGNSGSRVQDIIKRSRQSAETSTFEGHLKHQHWLLVTSESRGEAELNNRKCKIQSFVSHIHKALCFIIFLKA